MNDDTLLFADEEPEPERPPQRNGHWKVLVVDDEREVHSITRMVLEDFLFEGRKVHCLSAYSGMEARKLIVEHPDTAVMLLDVVMESAGAGLDVARYIREEERNRFVRIILRTGQPGEAPEQEVVTGLDINDYRHKTELTADRLVTAVTMAIRSYRDIKAVNEARRGLHLLAMSVAHQVRNRTIAIAGFANIIKRREKLPPEADGHLSTILDESARLESMVNDVTRYAAISISALEPSNIRDLLEEAMERVEKTLEGTGGTVAWDVFCPDQVVPVDPALFVDAFAAIMQNAVDFGGPNPTVRVIVSPDRLACAITISDTGDGIAEDDMPFIFDPFFSRKPKGSGMGLAVVRRVAMEHQWDVDVDSVPGKGTSVRVVIPRKELTGLA